MQSAFLGETCRLLIALSRLLPKLGLAILMRYFIEDKLISIKLTSIILQFPRKILYPTDFLPYGDSKMQAIADEFVKHLEGYLEVERSVISISERWSKCPPTQANGRSIREFLEKVRYNML